MKDKMIVFEIGDFMKSKKYFMKFLKINDQQISALLSLQYIEDFSF